ncbi:redoxin domain-containing protein [Isosphaeraceae bacterium EP7]
MAVRDRISWLLIVAAVAAIAYAALKPPAAVHPVTPPMLAAAGAMSGTRVTAHSAMGSDGRDHSPASEAANRPLVLVFIKDGCPCSEAAEPYFRRIHAAYGANASILGVIDGDLATARDWARRHGTPYPVLADPDRTIIEACKADRSAYAMLAAPGGQVEAMWPGYSSTMLAEVGAGLARLAGVAEINLDTAGAPDEMASGCSF